MAKRKQSDVVDVGDNELDVDGEDVNMHQNGNLPAVTGTAGNAMMAWKDEVQLCPMVLGGYAVASFELDDWEGKSLAINCLSPGSKSMDEGGVINILATNYFICPDTAVDDKTGEVKTFLRTVLVSADGETFRTSSEWLAQRIKGIFDACTDEEVAAGIPFVIRERKSRREKRTYHDLRIGTRPQKAS